MSIRSCRQQHVDRMRQLDAAISLYPVSVVFDPTFDMFTHRLGHGDRRSGWDVSSALTTHGSWQPSVQPNRRPSLADAVVGSLGLGSDLALVGKRSSWKYREEGRGGMTAWMWQDACASLFRRCLAAWVCLCQSAA